MKNLLLMSLILNFATPLAYSAGPQSLCAESFKKTEIISAEKETEVRNQLLPLLSQLKLDGNLSDIQIKSAAEENIVYEITYKNSKNTEEKITIMATKEKSSWSFEYIPAQQIPTTKDYYLATKLGAIQGKAGYVNAVILVEIESALNQIALNPSVAVEHRENILRIAGLMKIYGKSNFSKLRTDRLATIWQNAKAILAKELSNFEFSEKNLEESLTKKKLFSADGKVIGEPNSKTIDDFANGAFGESIWMIDGTGSTLKAEIKGKQLTYSVETFSADIKENDIKTWAETILGIKTPQIEIEKVTGFKQLQKITIMNTGSIEQILEPLKNSMRKMTSGLFIFNRKEKPPVVISNTFSAKVLLEAVKKNIPGKLSTIEEKIAFIQKEYEKQVNELKAKEPKNTALVHLGSKISPALLFQYVTQLFPETSQNDLKVIREMMKKATDDFLNSTTF